ncbi:unnamed protein product [Heligmosomoides polygyrus]|uniref:Reverse transcriptase domain-containing protein n=1 Tax=Heligmosomoides polygyrus TaxID=6339 RepID=A0A3P7YX20_HELPZ|nr:unnamed protein product [Heligmosomoides polygyrus]
MDSGAELSFICNEFADDFELPIIDNTTLLAVAASKEYGITTLQLCDIEGRQHHLRLYRSEYITGAIEQADLCQEGLNFIAQHGIALSMQRKTSALQPQILLRCDYLWNFMLPIGRLILPSGLQLIPTKLGYIVSGCQSEVTTEPARALTITTSNEEKETWDRYWALESSGTNEFTGSTRSGVQQTHDKVLKEFRNSIQRRDDGYYVRLPWKVNYASLPDNKSIAIKRLHKVLEMLSHDKPMLEQYDRIFKDQLEKGIIEEVSQQDDATERMVVHYLPHQAVLTPAKETTKMLIVFDASAHYKDKPCLNDVLHQGPLILPDMVSILLRFRAHKIPIISDVEKAFLQVRLQEIDRDATRCMWVRDIGRPPTPENIVVYRFTRVTFGLNASPFLLASTIEFHLDNMTSGSSMGQEIKENLYVDNLIIGAESKEEALDKYYIAKDIFTGLSMNLREYLSNDEDFNKTIADDDQSKTSSPKVLGVSWNPSKDTIVLRGTMSTTSIVTKRTVTMQLASVYDPLGLLVPVLLPAKVFLQSLWKDEYSWDTPLSPHLREQWLIISTGISIRNYSDRQ